MPVTILNPSLYGTAYKQKVGPLVNWITEVRNAPNATNTSTWTSYADVIDAVRVSLQYGRNEVKGRCNRTFLFFDLSSITGVITNMSLEIHGTGFFATSDIVPVESTAWGGNGSTPNLSLSDYSQLNYSNVYSPLISNWDSNGYNTFTLNTSAINSSNTNGFLNLSLINNKYDRDNLSPSVGTDNTIDMTLFNVSSPVTLTVTSTDSYPNLPLSISQPTINVNGVGSNLIGNIIGV